MNNKYVIAIEETLVQEFDISANNACKCQRIIEPYAHE